MGFGGGDRVRCGAPCGVCEDPPFNKKDGTTYLRTINKKIAIADLRTPVFLFPPSFSRNGPRPRVLFVLAALRA